MTTSFITAEVTFEISWSVAFKWYIYIGRESVFTDFTLPPKANCRLP